MIYRTEGMVLNSIQELFRGPSNEVLICQDLSAPIQVYYTLVVIKDRACARKALGILAEEPRGSESGEQGYLRCFSQNEDLCFLFEYRPERRLEAFSKGQMTSLYVREQTCINLVMACLSTALPYPFLYLILEQGNIHLGKDNSVYFTPYFDLSMLDEHKTEADCTRRCVVTILELLESGRKKKKQPKSYALLRRKIEKNAYQSFPELYRDIKVTAIPERREKWSARLKSWWRRNKDRLFRLLMVVCVILVVIAVIVLLSQIIFGDVPLFRIFEHSFDVIGTETLK